MSREWVQKEILPAATRLRATGGDSAPLPEAGDGEMVVRNLVDFRNHHGWRGAVSEVVRIQDREELVVGDRILVFDRAPCGQCERCRRGQATLCADVARVFECGFDRDFSVLPSWIARRGRVRLPVLLGDGAASELGRVSAIVRAMGHLAPDNPLRILVVGRIDLRAIGILLETRWPDARRVVWGGGGAEGCHGVFEDSGDVLEELGEPADFALVLEDIRGEELAPLVCPGCVVALLHQARILEPSPLWAQECVLAASVGAVPTDIENWRRWFPALAPRLEEISGGVPGEIDAT